MQSCSSIVLEYAVQLAAVGAGVTRYSGRVGKIQEKYNTIPKRNENTLQYYTYFNIILHGPAGGVLWCIIPAPRQQCLLLLGTRETANSMAKQGTQAAQRDGIDALLSAREKLRLDIAASMHEMMLAKFNELPKELKHKAIMPGAISTAGQQPAVGAR